MVQDGTGGCEAVSDVLVSEKADDHFVYITEKNLSESLFGAIVLVEECGVGVKIIARFGDLNASAVAWGDGDIAGVDGHDEGDGQQGVVRCG